MPGAAAAPRAVDGGTVGEARAVRGRQRLVRMGDGGRPDRRQGGGWGWKLESGGRDAGGRGLGGAGDRGVRRLGFSICRM
jgi:hypothetical protein